MTAGPTVNPLLTPMKARALRGAEWLSENAYIPPGLHRLLAAGSLAVGLWGGRAAMDIMVARRAEDGTEIKREQVPQLFRGLHGVLAYNPYSDNAADRWKSVADYLAPAAIGATTSFYGGKYFFHGKMPWTLDKAQNALHPLSENVRNAIKASIPGTNGKKGTYKISLAAIDHAVMLEQATVHRKIGAGAYWGGATIGTDKIGGMMPFNHNSWAVSFAAGGNIRPRFPVFNIPVVRDAMNFINKQFNGNYTNSSMGLMRAGNNASTWATANLIERGNPAEWLQHESDSIRRMAKDFLGLFPQLHKDEAALARVEEGIKHVIHDGWKQFKSFAGTPAEKADQLRKFIEGGADIKNSLHKTVGLSQQGIDHLLFKAQIPIHDPRPGEMGLSSKAARLLGGGKRELEHRKLYASYMKDVFNLDVPEHFLNPKLRTRETMMLGGGLALAVGTLFAAGSIAASFHNKRMRQVEKKLTDKGEPEDKPKTNNFVDWINDKPLDVAQWASRIAITPPSMHRLMSAGYLSAMLFVGMKVADTLTGRKLGKIFGPPSKSIAPAPEKMLSFLKPLYGKLSYTPGSGLVQDRLRQALHFIIPVGFGAIGTWSGSHFYFHDRIKRLEKPQALEDFTDRISLEQSNVFAGLTAVTSVFNTGSGIHLLPFFNYSSNLQSRYVLGDGRQIATPGIGQWWSGNAGLTPWGVKRTLTYMANYLAGNPDPRPTELPSLVHSLIGKIFPDLPADQLLARKQAMMNHIYELRDTYLHEGHVQKSKQPALKAAMKTLLSGEGFEQLLLLSGLDPSKADLAHNGVSGTIANTFGTGGKVKKLETEYRQKYAERLANYKARTTAEIIADHAAKNPATNDNAPRPANDNDTKKFVERVRGEETPGHER